MTTADRAALAHDVRLAEAEGGKPRLRAYQDSLGVWTIGLGTNLQTLVIDHATAERWFSEGLTQAERECERFPWFAGMSALRKRVLIELTYNLGIPRLLGFRKMLAAIAHADYRQAAIELIDSKWAGQVGHRRSSRLADMLERG